MSKSPFRLSVIPRASQLSQAVVVSASLKGTGDMHKLLLTIPDAVHERLRSQVSGKMGNAILGLVEYALTQLEESGQTLVVENSSES